MEDARIYKISGYLVDPNMNYDADEIKAFLEGSLINNCMVNLTGEHIHVEKAELEWDDDLPINEFGCDLAEFEKYFTPADDIYTFCRPTPMAGETWKHFKGKTVHIVGIARHSENTHHHLVIYNCPNGMYARPLDMFMSEVDREKYPDVAAKYRFWRIM